MKTFRQRLMHDVNESVTALSNGHDDAFKALEYGPVHLHVLVDITSRILRRKKVMQHSTLNLSRNLPSLM